MAVERVKASVHGLVNSLASRLPGKDKAGPKYDLLPFVGLSVAEEAQLIPQLYSLDFPTMDYAEYRLLKGFTILPKGATVLVNAYRGDDSGSMNPVVLGAITLDKDVWVTGGGARMGTMVSYMSLDSPVRRDTRKLLNGVKNHNLIKDLDDRMRREDRILARTFLTGKEYLLQSHDTEVENLTLDQIQAVSLGVVVKIPGKTD
jgi:hypothetical protein